MKPGDIIKCLDKADCLSMLKALEKKGIGAVVMDDSYRYIHITSVPQKRGEMPTLNEIHKRCVHGDRKLRVIGRCNGYWYEDHVLDFVGDHGNDEIQIMDEDDEMVTVKLI